MNLNNLPDLLQIFLSSKDSSLSLSCFLNIIEENNFTAETLKNIKLLLLEESDQDKLEFSDFELITQALNKKTLSETASPFINNLIISILKTKDETAHSIALGIYSKASNEEKSSLKNQLRNQLKTAIQKSDLNEETLLTALLKNLSTLSTKPLLQTPISKTSYPVVKEPILEIKETLTPLEKTTVEKQLPAQEKAIITNSVQNPSLPKEDKTLEPTLIPQKVPVQNKEIPQPKETIIIEPTKTPNSIQEPYSKQSELQPVLDNVLGPDFIRSVPNKVTTDKTPKKTENTQNTFYRPPNILSNLIHFQDTSNARSRRLEIRPSQTNAPVPPLVQSNPFAPVTLNSLTPDSLDGKSNEKSLSKKRNLEGNVTQIKKVAGEPLPNSTPTPQEPFEKPTPRLQERVEDNTPQKISETTPVLLTSDDDSSSSKSPKLPMKKRTRSSIGLLTPKKKIAGSPQPDTTSQDPTEKPTPIISLPNNVVVRLKQQLKNVLIPHVKEHFSQENFEKEVDKQNTELLNIFTQFNNAIFPLAEKKKALPKHRKEMEKKAHDAWETKNDVLALFIVYIARRYPDMIKSGKCNGEIQNDFPILKQVICDTIYNPRLLKKRKKKIVNVIAPTVIEISDNDKEEINIPTPISTLKEDQGEWSEELDAIGSPRSEFDSSEDRSPSMPQIRNTDVQDVQAVEEFDDITAPSRDDDEEEEKALLSHFGTPIDMPKSTRLQMQRMERQDALDDPIQEDKTDAYPEEKTPLRIDIPSGTPKSIRLQLRELNKIQKQDALKNQVQDDKTDVSPEKEISSHVDTLETSRSMRLQMREFNKIQKQIQEEKAPIEEDSYLPENEVPHSDIGEVEDTMVEEPFFEESFISEDTWDKLDKKIKFYIKKLAETETPDSIEKTLEDLGYVNDFVLTPADSEEGIAIESKKGRLATLLCNFKKGLIKGNLEDKLLDQIVKAKEEPKDNFYRSLYRVFLARHYFELKKISTTKTLGDNIKKKLCNEIRVKGFGLPEKIDAPIFSHSDPMDVVQQPTVQRPAETLVERVQNDLDEMPVPMVTHSDLMDEVPQPTETVEVEKVQNNTLSKLSLAGGKDIGFDSTENKFIKTFEPFDKNAKPSIKEKTEEPKKVPQSEKLYGKKTKGTFFSTGATGSRYPVQRSSQPWLNRTLKNPDNIPESLITPKKK